MKLNVMNSLVLEELSHIPRGPRGSTQNEFRAHYQEQRMHGLSKGKSRQETFLRCLRHWRAKGPPMPKADRADFFLE